MEALNHKLTLEMTTLNSQVTVRIKKNDTKNKLVISLSENGKPYKLTENVHAVFVGKKPDGKIVFNDCDIVGNKITYTITAQTSVAVGIVACEIRLYDTNDNLLTSPNFTIVVDETVYDADEIEIESENEINVLDSLISEAKALIAEVEATKNVFWAIYGTTTLEEIEAAVADGKTVICKCEESDVILQLPLTRHFHKARNAIFSGAGAYGDNDAFVYVASIGTSGVWSLKKHEIKDNDELFITEYDVTPFEDVADAIENGLAVFCKLTQNDETVLIPLTRYDGTVARFDLLYTIANHLTEWTLHNYSIFVSAAGWDTDEINTTGKIAVGGSAGVSITKVEQTTVSTEDGGTNIVTVTLTDGTTSTFSVKNGTKGSTGNDGADGIGISSVDVIESNVDGGNNEIYINLTDGTQKVFFVSNGKTGATGASGADGAVGADGVSCTHSWNGTTLTVTSASGTSSEDLKGEKGDTGAKGSDGNGIKTAVLNSNYTLTLTFTDGTTYTTPSIRGAQGTAGKDGTNGTNGTNGQDGTSVTVSDVIESTADGGSNVVTFSDGKTLTVKNGSKGSQGEKGDKGDTGAQGIQGIQGEKGEKGDTGSAGSDGADGKDGADGERGTGLLKVTTAPTSYTTATGGFTPSYRIALSTVLTQSNAEKVLIGDVLLYSYYHYSIGYVDSSYVYLGSRVSFRGATGSAGAAGADGYTPVKGTDYFTEADKAELISELTDKLSLGIASDGLIYIFVDGVPVGTGIPQGQTADVYGYIDENNHITFTGKNVPDGSYTCSFDMENGSTVPIGAFVKDTNTYYSITSNLTNCTNSNSATQIVEGGSYNATITANDGYELKSVSVTMGGSAVSVSGGVINIASVTGNIVITAVAEEVVVNYTNLADPTSSDWGTDKRLGSDGTFRDETGTTVTNYISIYAGQTVYIKGMDITTKSCSLYNDIKTIQSTGTLTAQTLYFTDISATTTGGQATFNYANGGTAANPWYVRFGGVLTGTANDVIITIDEPIV